MKRKIGKGRSEKGSKKSDIDVIGTIVEAVKSAENMAREEDLGKKIW